MRIQAILSRQDSPFFFFFFTAMLLGCMCLPQKSGEKKMFKHSRISLIRPQRTLSILIIEIFMWAPQTVLLFLFPFYILICLLFKAPQFARQILPFVNSSCAHRQGGHADPAADTAS